MVLTGLVVMAVAVAVAALLGGRPERWAAALTVVCWMLATGGELVAPHSPLPFLGGDLLYAAGLVLIARRYDRAWLWMMLAVEFVLVVGHVFSLLDPAGDALVYAAFVNVLGFTSLAVLAGGGVAAAAGRRRRADPLEVIDTPDPLG